MTEPLLVQICANPGCGKPAVAADKTRGGRPGRYCSGACRQAVYRAKNQPTPADLRRDAASLLGCLAMPVWSPGVLERVDAGQLPDLISFLRTATAGLSGVSAVLAAVAGPAPAAIVTKPAVTEPDAAALAAIADCFWCDENGLADNGDGDLVPCAHDDPTERPAAVPTHAGAASWGSPEYWATMPDAAPAAPEPARNEPTPKAKPSTPAPRRATIAGLRPTDEQDAIITACSSGGDLVVEAGAGTGKTSTLKMIGSTMRGRGLYVAFNRSIAEEAKRTFPRGVECRTLHSLAHRAVAQPYVNGRKLMGARVRPERQAEILRILSPLRVNSDLMLTQASLAHLAVEAVTHFCESADEEVSARHIRLPEALVLTELETQALRDVVLPYAQAAWKDLLDPNKKDGLRFEHSHYVKIWALTRPELKYDYLMLDEAQDTNPVAEKIVLSQTSAQRIAVGDPCQQLYAWRGAVDVMDRWPGGNRLLLSESFRFGPQIAAEANRWLGHLKSRLRLVGSGPAGEVASRPGPVDATLCRTNAGALGAAMRAMAAGRKVALVGGGEAIEKLAEAAISLEAGRGTNHPELMMFTTWDELRTYANTEKTAADLIALVRLIDTYGAQEMLAAAKSLTKNEASADVVVSTVHKAKGREWGRVRIADDFALPQPHPATNIYMAPPRPDMMLAYVAVTRAKKLLDRGGLASVDLIGTQARPRDEDAERHAMDW